MARSKEDSHALREAIRTKWLLNKSIDTIASELTEEKRFGKVDRNSVYYHIQKIQLEMENAVGIDAIEKYVAEFARNQIFMENEIKDIDDLIQNMMYDDKRIDELIKLLRLKHEVAKDKFSMLQDKELPLTVKKYKRERAERTKVLQIKDEGGKKTTTLVKRVLPAEIEDEGSGTDRDKKDSSK